MAILNKYKCKECGFSVFASENGYISLMRGNGHIYRCPECNELFNKIWSQSEIEQAVGNYSFAKDEYLTDLLVDVVPEYFGESFRRDVLWFQQEVLKGEESKYYGGVIWTDYAFWDKLILYVKKKKYAESINKKEIIKMVNGPDFKRNAAWANLFKKVKCSCCGENAIIWSPKDGCPKCGNTMELCFMNANNGNWSIPVAICID